VSAFRVMLGANDLNCVDVLLNPTHSLIVKGDVAVKLSIKCVQGYQEKLVASQAL